MRGGRRRLAHIHWTNWERTLRPRGAPVIAPAAATQYQTPCCGGCACANVALVVSTVPLPLLLLSDTKTTTVLKPGRPASASCGRPQRQHRVRTRNAYNGNNKPALSACCPHPMWASAMNKHRASSRNAHRCTTKPGWPAGWRPCGPPPCKPLHLQ